MHAREQIRAAFVTALTGTTSAASIQEAGVFPLYDLLLPAIEIDTPSEAIDPDKGRTEHIQYRALEITVIIHVKTQTGLAGIVDDLSEEIETAIFNNTALFNMTNCIDLISSEKETSAEGEVQTGILTLSFLAKYMTNEGQPGVIL